MVTVLVIILPLLVFIVKYLQKDFTSFAMMYMLSIVKAYLILQVR